MIQYARPKRENILESIVYYILMTLRRLKHGGNDPNHINSQHEALSQFVKISSTPLSSDMESKWNTSFATETNLLMEYYGILTCTARDRDTLEDLVQLFYTVSFQTFDSNYTVDNSLIPWINCVYSDGVIQACGCLTGLTSIPGFIIGDVLLRTPLNKEDLYYQVDLWMEYIHVVSSYYYGKPRYIKQIFEDIIKNCIAFDCHKLPVLLSHSLNYFKSPKTGYVFTFIDNDYINTLLWLTASHAFKTTWTSISSILKAQQVLVRAISDTTDNLVVAHLSFKGNLGIVLGLKDVAITKAQQLLESATIRLQVTNPGIKVNELKHYQIVSLAISKTPEELVNGFNSFGDVKSSDVWYSFIRKLFEFGMLNNTRSKSLLVELLKKSSTILLTKEILGLLLRTIDTVSDLEFMIRMFYKYNLHPHFKNVILRKYVQILYRTPHEIIRNSHQVRYLTKCYLPSDHKPLHTHVDYARYIYNNCFQYYSTSFVGVALQGEAKVDPNAFYTRYEDLLVSQNRMPDELCLLALLTSAMNVSQSDTTWGKGMYPAQMAVNVFKSNVMTQRYQEMEIGSNDETKVFPTDKLWQSYIQLLGKFEYTPELANIIEWWTSLKFTPNETTLLWLLHSLPSEYASLYIFHMDKVRHDSQKDFENIDNHKEPLTIEDVSSWPWPTQDKLKQFNASVRLNH
ncbi:uncharacterized protein KQ657_001294 [Scheffersomyces spartinae]|uniref:Uncharacterized protein n=1 Tax=Scheffersomyces spartinae TaxID=45513 RepID=A0A9P8AHT2_9ASCO|nr:uncharacterized protein KQ657_001294 [Scheffersomyces spartinae]KAG7192837.1 hypothetical protein KQ657_001294 [Scheffersomyces spartinae]